MGKLHGLHCRCGAVLCSPHFVPIAASSSFLWLPPRWVLACPAEALASLSANNTTNPYNKFKTPSPLQMAILALFQLHFDQAYFLVALQFLKINQYCLLAVLFFAFMAQLHHMGHLKSRSVLCALLHLTSCPANPNLPPPPRTLLQSHLASTLSACHCAH